MSTTAPETDALLAQKPSLEALVAHARKLERQRNVARSVREDLLGALERAAIALGICGATEAGNKAANAVHAVRNLPANEG